MASSRSTGRQRPSQLSDSEPSQPTDTATRARRKRAAAEAAAALVSDGMRLGLGTGSTVAFLLNALAARNVSGLRCVATSPATAQRASELGLKLVDLDSVEELDLAIDGADQIDPRGWLIKGGGAAHTREKIVAAAAKRFIVIASAEKAVARLHAPLPLELLAFGAQHTLTRLAPVRVRGGAPPTPDGGLIADYLGEIEDPRKLAARLQSVPGVISHGLFEPELVTEVLLAGAHGVQRRRVR